MFKEIDHLEITSQNMEESLKFYTEILGFQIIRRSKMDGSTGITEIAHLSLGDNKIELVEIPDAAPLPDQPHVGYRMMAITVEDMDAAIKYLKENNVEITREPVSMGKDHRGGFRGEFQDNNGVTIEIRQL